MHNGQKLSTSNFEREGVDAWRERRGGCGVGGRAS